MKRIINRVIVLILLVIITLNTKAMNPGEKRGILLVSFGSSYKESEIALNHIDSMVRKAFPESEIRWAFTSKIIRQKLNAMGKNIQSPAEALAQMGEEGFKEVAVQSLHVIPGEEYENLQKTVNAFCNMPKGIKTVTLGKPLLYLHNDVETLCRELEKTFPDERKPTDAVLLMGHGTRHPSNIYYPGVQSYLAKLSPNYLIATVEGYPLLNDVLPELKDKKVKTIWLMPFMSVAGDHALNDMAGDEADSWKSQLEALGYVVKPILKGMAESDKIVNIWISHLKEAYNELD